MKPVQSKVMVMRKMLYRRDEEWLSIGQVAFFHASFSGLK
jgi:hypothetical protein